LQQSFNKVRKFYKKKTKTKDKNKLKKRDICKDEYFILLFSKGLSEPWQKIFRVYS